MKFLVLVGVLIVWEGALAQFKQGALEQEKNQAIERLQARKKGFDQYQKRLQEWEQKRLARANEIKKKRAKAKKRRDKARRNFVRVTEEFPKNAYRDFMAKRKRQRVKLKESRKDYAEMQKVLKKVFENKKYRIDGRKEFKL